MLYPIMYKIKGKRVVVIGAGSVALRKVKDLTNAGADITVIAPEFHHELVQFANQHPNVTLINRTYQHGDCQGATLVFCATNDPKVNHEVFWEATQLNIPVNAVDDPDNSSFYVPSFFTRGSLLVAVSTGGASPAMAAKVRRFIEQSIPQDIENILEMMNEVRKIIKEDYSQIQSSERSAILKAIVADDKLLQQAMDAYKNNTLHEFINLIMKRNLTSM